MLGLASIVTALGAWQASVWNGAADEFSSDSSDARDVSVNQAVFADYARRVDQQSSAEALSFHALAEQTTDPTEQLYYQTQQATTLAKTTQGFTEAWTAWADGGFTSAANPLDDPSYVVARDGAFTSYGYTSTVLGDAGGVLKGRSGFLTQAALIYTLSLFLFGISGVNRLRAVRGTVVGLGVAVFLGGILLASTAFGG